MSGLDATIAAAFDEHAKVLADSAAAIPPVLRDVIEEARACLLNRGAILVCGNGGSAADAQHFAAELVCRLRTDRRALPAVALTTDTSALTAIANDYGYERVFARQVEALARAGDLLVAISTSGSSANVLAAAATAHERGCTVVALTGAGGGPLAAGADHVLAVPSTVVSRIQEVHALCLHILAEALEDAATGAGERP